MPQDAKLAILFADVSGSTQLYSTLGDDKARGIIARCVQVMTETANRHGGTLIKTIGDEVMTYFPTADAAAAAAFEMQETVTGMRLEGRRLAIHVGFHYGPVLLENGDVFGDAVNVAARMAHRAKTGQILTTGGTVALMTGPMSTHCRQIDYTQVRGRNEELAIHELVWEASDATIIGAPWALQHETRARLVLAAGPTRVELSADRPTMTLGRDDQNDLVVPRARVSRLHARIDYRKGRFVLTDLSANGTYVAPERAQSHFLHRDSQELSGSGTLGLGEAAAPGSLAIVRYQLFAD